MGTYPGGVRICTWTEHQGTPRGAVFLGVEISSSLDRSPLSLRRGAPAQDLGGGGYVGLSQGTEEGRASARAPEAGG